MATSRVFTFETTAERDAFLSREFPERRCMAAPGHYRVKGGRVLSVFLLNVTLNPPPSRPRKSGRVPPPCPDCHEPLPPGMACGCGPDKRAKAVDE